MTPRTQSLWLAGLLFRALAPRPVQRVSDWCEQTPVVFNEPNCRGPFSFGGREYLREPLDWYQSADTDLVLCFGTRLGKTRVLFGGKMWLLVHEPCRMLCVMPNTNGTGGAQNVARTRFIPALRATGATATLIPTGNQRQNFKTLQQILGGSIIDWAGSNSPANLASNPARYVEQDEVDKYKRMGDREADPSKLADERCKEFSNPKRAKASTPTLVSGLIWQELLKTDMRRRFLPCPHCQKFVVLAWHSDFTVLPKTGCEAYVRWDPEARRKDGNWDLDRVERSARAECPHCGGHIRDTHKTRMDRAGEWRPTKEGTPGMRGYHLPSMYSASRQTNFGQMAIRFLTAKRSIQGLQGFINSDLAEPYEGQENRSKRIELITTTFNAGDDWRKIMTVDCQARAPHFWFVVRAWSQANSEGLEAGSCDTYDELREVQQRNGVLDVGVFVDSGFGAKSDAEVYRACAEYCQIGGQLPDGRRLLLGWTPTKGFDGQKKWRDDAGDMVPYHLRPLDPFLGTSDAGKVSLNLLEFAADFFKDILANLRAGRGGFRWAVAESMATAEYWRHLDGQVKREVWSRFSGRTHVKWMSRSSSWPDHLLACEYQNVAAAVFLRQFPLEAKQKK